jgi:3-hydroxyisobutyrate dehydrogenase
LRAKQTSPDAYVVIKDEGENSMAERIGVVGIGRMGANIARRLKDVGYDVSALYDVAKDRVAELAAELGATGYDTLAAVTANADVIITVVTDDAAQLGIFATSGDSLLTGAAGKVFINCATITPKVHVEAEERAAAAGAQTVECLMASSIPQAREGKLYLICGNDEAAFTKVKPILDKMSISLKFVGGPGKAAQVKALINMLMNINTAGLAEALGLGDALGLDLTMLREVFSQTGANSRVLETDGGDMQARDHEAYFSAEHAAKDSGIALQLAKDAGLDLPLAAATKAQYDQMVKLGLGQLDKSGISELTFTGRHP